MSPTRQLDPVRSITNNFWREWRVLGDVIINAKFVFGVFEAFRLTAGSVLAFPYYDEHVTPTTVWTRTTVQHTIGQRSNEMRVRGAEFSMTIIKHPPRRLALFLDRWILICRMHCSQSSTRRGLLSADQSDSSDCQLPADRTTDQLSVERRHCCRRRPSAALRTRRQRVTVHALFHVGIRCHLLQSHPRVSTSIQWPAMMRRPFCPASIRGPTLPLGQSSPHIGGHVNSIWRSAARRSSRFFFFYSSSTGFALFPVSQ